MTKVIIIEDKPVKRRKKGFKPKKDNKAYERQRRADKLKTSLKSDLRLLGLGGGNFFKGLFGAGWKSLVLLGLGLQRYGEKRRASGKKHPLLDNNKPKNNDWLKW